jgi:hypothetical protein
VIADWYQAKPRFEQSWEAASDKCGRLQLYKEWRRGRGLIFFFRRTAAALWRPYSNSQIAVF